MDFTPHTDAEIAEMLRVIGADSIDDLFASVPEAHRLTDGLDLPGPLTEPQVLRSMDALAKRNRTTRDTVSFLGGGAYDHYVPSVIRHLIGRGEFLTAYTPYQPELSQGTLQAQFEYQTLVAGLLGLDVANASMYEGATALAEACLLACRHTRRPRILVSEAVHPEYRKVLETYLEPGHVTAIPADGTGTTPGLSAAVGPDVAAVVVQNPNFFGCLEDAAPVAEAAHGAGALCIGTFTEPLAFGLIEPPGRTGADLAAGEGQSLGLPLSFGGPYIGMFAVRNELVKAMPGRLIGRTVDRRGTPCYTLTLAAREQHIRRANASSNICSNEALCAVAVAIYLSLLGGTGLPRLARYNHHRSELVKARLGAAGIAPAFSGPTFNEFVVRLPRPAEEVVAALAPGGLVPGLALGRVFPGLADCLLVTVTETASDSDIERLIGSLAP
jgi:glycine dehydrogenase subunit 1